MPTERECKSIILKLAVKHGVSPKLISERLLSTHDKNDMIKGDLTYEILDISVYLWKDSGCCDNNA